MSDEAPPKICTPMPRLTSHKSHRVSVVRREWTRHVEAMLDECMYIEDVDAMAHFVFHPRLNGCSNMCLLCHFGTDGEHKELGHDEGCLFPATVDRLLKEKTLASYMERF